jgi:long-chain acyl-CoA synthetase
MKKMTDVPETVIPATDAGADEAARNVRVRFDDTKMESNYANVANVGMSKDEVTLLFGTNQTWGAVGDEIVIALSSRIIMTPSVAKNFAATLQQVLAKTPMKHVIVTAVGDLLRPLKGHMVNFVLRHVKRAVPAYSIPGAWRLKKVLAQGQRKPFQAPSLILSDLACLQYTGGTTGVSKGAMLSHGNLVANVCQAYSWIRPLVKEGQECIVTALPLYHIFALTANCLTFLKAGASNLLIINARDIPALVKEMATVPFSGFTGVNTLFNALLNDPNFAKLDFSHLRLTLGGGMAVQRKVAEQWHAVTGNALAQAYGLTETSPAVTINPLDVTEFTGSIGLPVPSTEISIRNDQGQEVPLGQSGEICVRGPQVMVGYWKQPNETALVLYPDGFLRTGDIGYVNAEGYVFLVDRKKDMILVSGFNVYPNEVEDVASLHPGVLEVAANLSPLAPSSESNLDINIVSPGSSSSNSSMQIN